MSRSAQAASAPLARVLLLCIDMQPAFLKVIAGGEQVRRRCAFALAAARGFGLPVAFTEQAPAKLGATAPELLALCDRPRVIAKDAFSAFAAPELPALLRQHGAEHVILCGIETPVCVYQTALAAIEADLQVTLLTDCVGARRPDDAAAALAALARPGCHLLPAETVFYALLGDTRHPFFKAFTQLVKRHAN